ncbi:2-hydroxyacid dehydrogenase [Marinomonas epiphytica]
MKVAVFSSKPYDERSLAEFTSSASELTFSFFESRLSLETVSLAKGYELVCCFVNDQLTGEVLTKLQQLSVKGVVLRCAGYNNVDLEHAKKLGIKVYYVPDYSPTSVAEHAVALIMALNRKTHRAFHRVKENNFALEGLLGFNLEGKTVGSIGAGRIGESFCRIMRGFGCTVLYYDLKKNTHLDELGCQHTDLNFLYQESDIISLHCPLNEHTHHLINRTSLKEMQTGVMLINTSRGGLVHAQDAIEALYSGQIGYLGLDVYEYEGSLFFEDLSARVIQDSVFQLLLSFPNVIVTGHQGYFTKEALAHIANTTILNIRHYQEGKQADTQLV